MTSRAPRILIVALAVQILIGAALVYAASRDFDFNGDNAGASPQRAAQAAKLDRFDEQRAWRLLVEQVERFGPRPAGSEASKRLAERLRTALPSGKLEPLGDRHPGLRNVVGTVPGRKPAIVVGAHYDTEARPVGHVGANDGAAGTAAVVELARTLRRARRPAGAPEIRFVLFDGEEEPAGCEDFAACGLRGSKAYVRDHRREVRAMILLDYIAEKGTRIPREANSDIAVWGRLRASARRAGVRRTFPDQIGPSLLDDHIPFVEAGIPAIDIIDFDYPDRDTLRDTPDKLSVQSLDAVGETVADLLVHWPR
jgi:glutaminyl-peptide cyclotransferase